MFESWRNADCNPEEPTGEIQEENSIKKKLRKASCEKYWNAFQEVFLDMFLIEDLTEFLQKCMLRKTLPKNLYAMDTAEKLQRTFSK